MHPPSYWKTFPASRTLRGLLWVLVILLPAPAAAQGINIRRATIEALDLLRVLVQQDTTNPPGNEVLAARPLAVFFSDKGIGCELLEPEPGRGNLLCRLRGDGSARPLLVMTHLDTAAVDAGKWSVPPHSGRLRNNHIYGRGVLEGKGFAAVAAEALWLLSLQGPPARDVLFLGLADGEMSGEFGLAWLLEHRPELLDAEMALTGGGRLVKEGDEVVAVAVHVDYRATPSSPSPVDAPLPQAIRTVIERLAPGVKIETLAAPHPAGFRLLRQRGIPAYGLSPFPLEEDEHRLTHGEDERLSLRSFDSGVRLMYELLREATAP